MKQENDMNNEKKEIVKSDDGFLSTGNFDLGSAMADEMDGLRASFERIRIPAGGSTMFELPSEDPSNPEMAKEFKAVILYHHPIHAYYTDAYQGGSNPPDCGSMDGKVGIGTPGGECARCPLNRFGSGSNNSKACKNRRRLYLLREGDVFPVILSLPTGSLKDFSRYVMMVLNKGCKTNGVVTRFTLKKATNSSGIQFSQAQFSIDRRLTGEESAAIARMSEQVKDLSRQVGYDMDDPPRADVSRAEIEDEPDW